MESRFNGNPGRRHTKGLCLCLKRGGKHPDKREDAVQRYQDEKPVALDIKKKLSFGTPSHSSLLLTNHPDIGKTNHQKSHSHDDGHR
jgi:hypothetical protein